MPVPGCLSGLAALSLALLTAPVQAQVANVNAWTNLSRLHRGDRIEIVQMDLKKFRGEFGGVSEEALVLTMKSAEMTVPREKIFRISSLEKSKRLRNLLLGAAIGGGAALAIGALVDRGFSEEDEHIAKTVFTPIGLGAGAGVGAAIPGFETIYRAPRKSQPVQNP